eukprot:1160308-Pelagomonas_calceolata.AAC.2
MRLHHPPTTLENWGGSAVSLKPDSFDLVSWQLLKSGTGRSMTELNTAIETALAHMHNSPFASETSGPEVETGSSINDALTDDALLHVRNQGKEALLSMA